jgi:hypothetical protein
VKLSRSGSPTTAGCAGRTHADAPGQLAACGGPGRGRRPRVPAVGTRSADQHLDRRRLAGAVGPRNPTASPGATDRSMPSTARPCGGCRPGRSGLAAQPVRLDDHDPAPGSADGGAPHERGDPDRDDGDEWRGVVAGRWAGQRVGACRAGCQRREVGDEREGTASRTPAQPRGEHSDG